MMTRARADKRYLRKRALMALLGALLCFGTLMVRLATGAKETPPVASSRAYLRNGLPAMYQDGDFGMRFVGALESVLDPIVAVLDALPAHFNPDHAPRDILNLLASWLGVEDALDGTSGDAAQLARMYREIEANTSHGSLRPR